jgi:hypothetical protein
MALELNAGEPVPYNEVNFCGNCQRPYYLARSKNKNTWTHYKSDRAAYKAAAVLTDKGYVAAPFQPHHGTLPGYGGGTRRSACPHEPYLRYSLLNEDKKAEIRQKVDNEDAELRTKLRVNPPTSEMNAQVEKFGRILPNVSTSEESASAATAPQPTPSPAEKPKGFTNKFPGNCKGCNTRVGVGEGLTSKGNAGWEVRCVGCHHG